MLQRADGLSYYFDLVMPKGARQSRVSVDRDGVRTVRRGRSAGWLIAVAVGVPVLVTAIVIAIIRLAPAGARPTAVSDTPEPERLAADAGASALAARSSRRAPAQEGTDPHADLQTVTGPVVPREAVIPRRSERAADRSQGVPTPIGQGDDESIDARDAIPALIAAGETGGITVFPLPATKPIKRGVVVPDDFQLPEGYVRHYQTTDDGQQLPPILMFHPDYEFVDAHGNPIAVPPDRIVPPQLAPPGLDSTRILEPPDERRATGVR